MRSWLCASLLAASALAQGVSGAKPSPMVGLLEKQLSSSKEPFLVVLDTPKGAWKSAADALEVDPEWVELEVEVLYYAARSKEMEPSLRRVTTLGPLPQWVLFKQGGSVISSGGTAFDAGQLLKAAREAGLTSYTQRLRAFCQRYPDHMEAQHDCFYRGAHLAARRTAIKLGLKIEPRPSIEHSIDLMAFIREREAQAEAKAAEPPKPPAMLEPGDDARIWTDASERMVALFRQGDWLEVFARDGLELPEEARRSGLMAEAARACVPFVEGTLRRSPTNLEIWRTWLSFNRVMGGRPIRPLLDSLIPLPGQDINRQLPESVRATYVRDARQRQDWGGIRDLLLPILEDRALAEASFGPLSIQFVLDGKVHVIPETGEYWRESLEPLVEALLMLGESSEADTWVTRRWEAHPWSELPSRAAALATRCGQPGLAAKWAALAKN